MTGFGRFCLLGAVWPEGAKPGSMSRAGRPNMMESRLWWLMPPGPTRNRDAFALSLEPTARSPTESQVRVDSKTGEYYDVVQGKMPVLRYNYGSVPVPEGTHKHFEEGESYERGDYISPTCSVRRAR